MFELGQRPFGRVKQIILISGICSACAQFLSDPFCQIAARASETPAICNPMKNARTARRHDLLLERLEDRILFDAVPAPTVELNDVSLQQPADGQLQQFSLTGGDDAIILNTPDTYLEAQLGTGQAMLPVPGSPLIDAGTSTAVRGLDNLMGPHLGAAPDVGAYEVGLGQPWTGPRSFTNLLAYGLPAGWRVGSTNELASFSGLAAPGSVNANNFRLLLVQGDPAKPQAYLLVTFEEMQGEARWNRFDAIRQGQAGDAFLVQPLAFRDGLGASIVRRGDNALLLGARVDDEGVLKIQGGVKNASLQHVQDDMFTFVRSLYYAFNLQSPTAPTISLNFVAPPTPGVVAVGSNASPDTGNATLAGQLRGDVTLASASIIWDVQGDANANATSRLQFRRQGTTAWRDALDLSRVKYTDHHTGQAVNQLAGSIFHLSPGTTYEIQTTLVDPDGGSVTRTTTFTTRTAPKISNPGKVTEVRATDNLDAVLAAARPGDTLLLHAGDYKSNTYGDMVVIDQSGTQANPILLQAYGDGEVRFTSILVKANHIWIDGVTVNQAVPVADGPILSGIRAISVNNAFFTGITLTRNTVKNGNYVINADANEFVILDNRIIGSDRKVTNEGIEFDKTTRGHVAAFNDITAVYDGISYGQGNVDLHNNAIHHIGDNSIEPDFSWDNYRVWENRSWDVGNDDISFQPMNGGPWYVFRNQITGAKVNAFKMRSGNGEKFVIANSIVSAKGTLNAHYMFQDGGIFANNYWKALSIQGGNNDSLGGGGDPQASRMKLWGYNGYDASPNNVWGWYGGTLAGMQAQGAELHTQIVNRQFTTTPPPAPPSNGTPVATAQSLVARQNTPLTIQLLGSDPNKDVLTYALVNGQGPVHGTISNFNASTGTLTYTPLQDFTGNDTFAFTVKDATSTSIAAVVSIRTIVPMAIDQQGLVGHWRMDDGGGNTAKDYSGNGNTGSLQGGTAATAGKIGGALQFDGVDDHVRVADKNSLDITGAMTIALWIKSDGLVNNNAGLVSKSSDSTKYGAAPANSTYEFGVNFGNLYFKISNGSTSSLVIGDEKPLIDGTWHHVAAVWDGTKNADGLKIYIDGVETYTDTSTISAIQSKDWALDIGGFGQRPFQGSLDDVAVFSRALNPGEILTLASGRASSNPPQIAALIANAVDRSTEPGLQIFEGDTVGLSVAASDVDSGPLNYAWSFQKNGGPALPFFPAQGVTDVLFTYPLDSVGATYRWTIQVSDGVENASQSLEVEVISALALAPVEGPSLRCPWRRRRSLRCRRRCRRSLRCCRPAARWMTAAWPWSTARHRCCRGLALRFWMPIKFCSAAAWPSAAPGMRRHSTCKSPTGWACCITRHRWSAMRRVRSRWPAPSRNRASISPASGPGGVTEKSWKPAACDSRFPSEIRCRSLRRGPTRIRTRPSSNPCRKPK
jgi:hypothetical protein